MGDVDVRENLCNTRACYVSSWVGRGGVGDVKFFQIERKITSVVHSHPPSHYIGTHVFCPQHDD